LADTPFKIEIQLEAFNDGMDSEAFGGKTIDRVSIIPPRWSDMYRAPRIFPTCARGCDRGDWCRADGKRMTIRGAAIVTPGGQKTSGNYTRHFFSYVIPSGEAGAGATVSIQLLSEYLAHAKQGADAPVQEWRRCQPGVS
jgi:hypothetical protein